MCNVNDGFCCAEECQYLIFPIIFGDIEEKIKIKEKGLV